MEVFKSFFKVARQNKSGMIMYSSIVVVMVILLSTNSSGKSDMMVSASKYMVYVEDLDDSEESRALVQYIGKIHNIYKGKLNNNQIMDNLYYQHIACYITIPEGFGKTYNTDDPKEITIIYDEAIPRGAFVNMQINEAINGAIEYENANMTFAEGLNKTYEALNLNEFVTIMSDKDVVSVTNTLFTFLPFGVFSIIFATLLPVVVNYNKKEIKDRINASSLKNSTKVMAIVAGIGVFSIGVAILLLAVATIPEAKAYLFSKQWFVSVLAVLVYTFACMTLLSLISNLPFMRQEATSMVTNIVGLSFAFLGGTFVPLELLGKDIKKLGKFVPNYWYSKTIENAFEMNNYGKCFTYIGVILAFAFACLGLSLMLSKYSEER